MTGRYGYSRRKTTVLTQKEVEALTLICEDKTGYQVSIALGVDPSNITRRLNSAKMKLGAETIWGAALKFDRQRRTV